MITGMLCRYDSAVAAAARSSLRGTWGCRLLVICRRFFGTSRLSAAPMITSTLNVGGTFFFVASCIIFPVFDNLESKTNVAAV